MHPFTSRFDDSIAAWGEEKLIAVIRTWLGRASPPAPYGIGDDCAVLPGTRRRQLITVDPVIYDQHFDDSVPPRAVGIKLLKRNLSDLAAMGGRPTAAVVSLGLDSHVDLHWLEEFYRGLGACAREYHVPIVGGDLARADKVVVASLTLLGEATGPRILTRTGAALGDWIYVTGQLGLSGDGHHYRFTPRLAEGAWLARKPAVRAMMDLSDGLAKDIWALTPKGAFPALDPDSLPRRPRAQVKNAVSDGEDYELVFAVRANTNRARFEQAWRRSFPKVRLSCIGQFVHPRKQPAHAMNLAQYRGYEHLRA